MFFPAFKFMDIAEQEWEESDFYKELTETKFLFVVFKEVEDKKYILKGCQFWNIPYKDLNVDVKSVFEKTKQVILDNNIIDTTNRGKRVRNSISLKQVKIEYLMLDLIVQRMPNQMFFLQGILILNNVSG